MMTILSLMIISSHMDYSLDETKTILSFNDIFNSSIINYIFPDSISSIIFGYTFNQNITSANLRFTGGCIIFTSKARVDRHIYVDLLLLWK
jgi:TRAP-type C4-dicarboxylate transport system permease large subunit